MVFTWTIGVSNRGRGVCMFITETLFEGWGDIWRRDFVFGSSPVVLKAHVDKVCCCCAVSRVTSAEQSWLLATRESGNQSDLPMLQPGKWSPTTGNHNKGSWVASTGTCLACARVFETCMCRCLQRFSFKHGAQRNSGVSGWLKRLQDTNRAPTALIFVREPLAIMLTIAGS